MFRKRFIKWSREEGQSWSGLENGNKGRISKEATMKAAAMAIITVVLNCGLVSVCSTGSTAQTLLFPSTSR